MNTKAKASEIISNTCCGQLLDIPVVEMVKKVEKLERETETMSRSITNLRRINVCLKKYMLAKNRELADKNRSLTARCDLLLTLTVVFACVVLFL